MARQISDQEQKDRIVRAVITGSQERCGVDDDTLAKYLGIAASTLRKKKRMPGTFTLDELQTLSRVLKLTPFQEAAIMSGRELTAKEIKDFILL